MEKATKAILTLLFKNRCFGGKHFPEDKLLKSVTRRISKEERKNFNKEYKKLIGTYIMRSKKRTGKGSSFHISLNSSMSKEIREMIGYE